MENDEGVKVDLYIPRKCSWTNRLITAGDTAAVQINIGEVDPATGLYIPGQYKTFAFSGFVRQKGDADEALNQLLAKVERPF